MRRIVKNKIHFEEEVGMNKQLSSNICSLDEKIATKQAVVAIIGLGYVGLPLALEVSQAGFSTIGLDKDEGKIHTLNNNESYIVDLSAAKIKQAIDSKKLFVTTQFEFLQCADVIIICVPTPTTASGGPNTTFIEAAVRQIALHVKEDTLVILESTTYPGTTREIVYPALKKSGIEVGERLFIAYSPERIDPGNKFYNVQNTPKVVGGLTANCTTIAKVFYENVLKTTVYPVSTPEVAEMEKLLENTFRQVNIALINEISKVCHVMNINIWEVIDAADTKPYGFMRFSPGPGVGGHCIPVDPQYLQWIAARHGKHLSLIDTAQQVNLSMAQFVVERLENYLAIRHKTLEQAKIVIIGAAYKADVNDMRESPAVPIIEKLMNTNCDVHIVDPFINIVCGMATVTLTKELVEGADGVVILTNHQEIDYPLIDVGAKFIFDTRQTNYAFKNQHYYKL